MVDTWSTRHKKMVVDFRKSCAPLFISIGGISGISGIGGIS